MTVLAIDPGREKCGLAVVRPGRVLHREVVARDRLAWRVAELAGEYAVHVVVVGDATGSQEVLREVSGLGRPVETVPERGSSLEARRRYFRDHPARGLARLIPEGLRVPPRPVDDYVAEILAERFLEKARLV
ncbi:MAG: resolvase [Armatimonadota bacterium]|nr:resolvase [Armatimonadota bacterium]MDR7564468.1 resolvase [Armatimonadota bacterium]MDR7578929.1 resolvase [Armatimonadota bacterium]MDR7595960.1 resolvase [Armatimonadota bacterium]